MSGDESFLVGNGGEGGSGIEETLFLRRHHVWRQTPRKRIVNSMLAVIDDTALDRGNQHVSVHRTAKRILMLHIHIVVVQHHRIVERYRVRYRTVTRHLPGLNHRFGTRRFGSGHKGRCQQH